jgi:hypothetical protein
MTDSSIDPGFESLIPSPTEEELKRLEQGLLREGCRDALVVGVLPTEGGSIRVLLDGHTRYKLCVKHGIAYHTIDMEFPSREAAEEWIVRNQFARRNLSPYQRSELALRLERVVAARSQQGRRTDLSPEVAESEPLDTREEVARIAGVSHGTLSKARLLVDQAPEEVKARLRSGETTISREYDRLREEKRREEKRARKEALPVQPDFTSRHQLIEGDLAQVGHEVEGKSLDAIPTDPPYGEDSLPLYSELGSFAARTLKPGGSLLVMTGQLYLPEVIRRLGEHLRYRWTLAYLLKGPHSTVWPASARQQWKPVLWFTNGPRSGNDRITDPGQSICDPFLGGGTTAVVAMRMNRLLVGIDIDPAAIESTRQRLTEEMANLASASTQGPPGEVEESAGESEEG